MFRKKEASSYERGHGIAHVLSLFAPAGHAAKLTLGAFPALTEWIPDGYHLDNVLVPHPREWKLNAPTSPVVDAEVAFTAEVFKALPTKTFEQLSPQKKARV